MHRQEVLPQGLYRHEENYINQGKFQPREQRRPIEELLDVRLLRLYFYTLLYFFTVYNSRYWSLLLPNSNIVDHTY